MLAGIEEPDKLPFAFLLKSQIKSLREQLGAQNVVRVPGTQDPPARTEGRDVRAVFGHPSAISPRQNNNRIYAPSVPGGLFSSGD